MWFEEAVFYQIYPMGFCGAPVDNDGITVSRILKALDWIEHFQKLGIQAIYFSPIFESDHHGYDTRDFSKLDCRLGTNEDFKLVVEKLHEAGIRVVIDGVFNHVGRGFFAFQDVLEKKWDSPYKDWFVLNFDGNNAYNDGLWYEGWEGHYELVKLNLYHPPLVDYLMQMVTGWIKEFDIDGIRLDVAYSLEPGFMERLRATCDSLKPEFFLLGEMLHGDYNRLVSDRMLHSVTNYECYKGLYSSFNSKNMFEIAHSINRQFGKENWCLYRGKHLLCFVDNHDVSRIASQLTDKNHLPLIYGLLFTMPGIPCIYYGSEWGCEGAKGGGSDWHLRPSFEKPEWNELTDFLQQLAKIRLQSRELSYGDYEMVHLTNYQYMFKREIEGSYVIIAINIANTDYTAHFQGDFGQMKNCMNQQIESLCGSYEMKPYSFAILRKEQ